MNVNQYFKSTPSRCVVLEEYIKKSADKELAVFYPKLIAEIFNPNGRVNWGLRTLHVDTNYKDFTEVFDFLHPNGALFRLCLKLLFDEYRFEYPYQYLPAAARRRLEDIGDMSVHKQKFGAGANISSNSLSLNSFEYYMFHFAYHLIDPAAQPSGTDENSSDWDTVYLRLVESYLEHFVPCLEPTDDPFLDSPSMIPTAQQKFKSFSPPFKTPSSLFRREVLDKMSPPNTPLFTKTKMSSSTVIWRSELVATSFLDFWLSCKNDDYQPNKLFSGKTLWSVEAQPAKDQLRCVRALLRHLQYFSNHLLPQDCLMNDLKREFFSNNRRTIYDFFHRTMTQLPLDSSYRVLLEGWFTYIQPWRYTNPYDRKSNDRPIPVESVDRRWVPFISENLIMYTRLYYVVMARLMGCDLTTYKISTMIYRLVQVFSQPQLLDLITEVEKCFEDNRASNMNSWNSIIRQNICSLEKATFRYDHFHSEAHLQLVIKFINQIDEKLPILRLRRQQLQESDNVSFVKWMKEQLSGNVPCASSDEIVKIECLLYQSRQKLCQLHEIHVDDPYSNSLNWDECNRSTNSFLNASSGYDSVDGSILSNSSLSVDPKVRRKIALSFSYEGDPDLYPIRSWENKFLVRLLYKVCLWINLQFQHDLRRLYYEDNIIGGIFRQIMSPPQRMYYYEKRIPPEGYSRRVSAILPPRMSLRWCASYYFIFSCLSVYGILKFFHYSVFHFFLLAMFFCAVYLIMNSVLSPVPAREDEDDLTSR